MQDFFFIIEISQTFGKSGWISQTFCTSRWDKVSLCLVTLSKRKDRIGQNVCKRGPKWWTFWNESKGLDKRF